MAKRRAAFLLKQQRKAEETRLRKQQLEAESELKRDEARYIFSTHSHRLLKSKDKELQRSSYILPVINVLPIFQGVRQRKTVFARRRRRRAESSLSRNTCEGSSKRCWKNRVWSNLNRGLNPAGVGRNHCTEQSPTASPKAPLHVRTPSGPK